MSACELCTCDVPFIGPSLSNTCYGGTFVLFMAILNEYITKTRKVSEMCERVVPKTKPDDWYDFVVIGSGSSGSVAAGRLAEIKNFKVLLLEAGGDEPPGSQVPSMVKNYLSDKTLDWNFKVEPSAKACVGREGGRCVWPRGKVLGGTSVIHGMMYMRGVPKDYDNWEKMGNKGWSFKDLIKHFKASEKNLEFDGKYHGKDGPMDVMHFNDHPKIAEDLLLAGKEIGYEIIKDMNGEKHEGFTIAQANVR